MKIAITTWFHYQNYGTALQVYALSTFLNNQGNDVDVVNYIPDGQVVSLPQEKMIVNYLEKIKKKIVSRKNSVIELSDKSDKFNDFLTNIRFTNRCSCISDFEMLNGKYDVFIVGSDQIWSPLSYDVRYFFDYINNPGKLISYAPSIGVNSIQDKYIEKNMKKYISRFNKISCREKVGAEMIGKLVERDIEEVVDPTLLLSASEWKQELKLKQTEKQYLLVYFLGTNKKYWEKVYEVSKILNLSLKIIPVYEKDKMRAGVIDESIGPREFVEYFYNASFVCTDSFHGTAFSLIFNKKMLVFERFSNKEKENQNSRIYNILSKFNLKNRLYNESTYQHEIMEEINYQCVNEILTKERKKSENYLLNAIEAAGGSEIDKDNSVDRRNTPCCGCGACQYVCPVQAIKMDNSCGFKKASVNRKICLNCGKCVNVCPFIGRQESKKICDGKLLSYKDNDRAVLLRSSSGGIAYRIAYQGIISGCYIVGCKFNKEQLKAETILIKDKESINELQGSKYLQSSNFNQIIKKVQDADKNIILFGTPCQIAGIKKIFGDKKDIIYVDLICHGVPSQSVISKYFEYLKRKYGFVKKNTDILFRDKKYGWEKRYISVFQEGKIYSEEKKKDPFYRLFESGFCYSNACYECRWRDKSNADIRIGDYWGGRFKGDASGVNMVVVMSQKGAMLIDEIKDYGQCENQNIMDYLSNQQTENVHKPVFYDSIISDLENESISIEEIISKYVLPIEKQIATERTLRKVKNKVQSLNILSRGIRNE